MTTYETREKLHNPRTFVEVPVGFTPMIHALQAQLSRSYPTFVPQGREKLHITLGYFGRPDELFARVNAYKAIDRRVFDDVYEAFLVQVADTTKNGGTVVPRKLEIFNKGTVVMTFVPESMLLTSRSAVYELFVFMFEALGLTIEEGKKLIEEGEQTVFSVPGTARLHLTIGNVPEGTDIILPKVPKMSLTYGPSVLKKRA